MNTIKDLIFDRVPSNLGAVCLALRQANEAKNYYIQSKEIFQQTERNRLDAYFNRRINESSRAILNHRNSSSLFRILRFESLDLDGNL